MPSPLRVIIVSRDPAMRLAAARAFDAAPPSWNVQLSNDGAERADVLVLTPEIDEAPDSAAPLVAFDPLDPLAAVAAVARAGASRSPSITAVLGATGGCGATTIAMYLAKALAPEAAFVEVGDPGGSTLSARFDLALTGARAGPVTVQGFHAYVVSDASEVSDLSEHRRAIVDLGCGGAPIDGTPTLCVLPPSLVAARRAARIIGAHPKIPWIVVTNRVGAGGNVTRMELQQELSAPISLELAACPALRDSEESGRLADGSWRRWHRGIGRLARAIERHAL